MHKVEFLWNTIALRNICHRYQGCDVVLGIRWIISIDILYSTRKNSSLSYKMNVK